MLESKKITGKGRKRPYQEWRTLPLKAQTRGRQDKRKNQEAVTRNTNVVQGFILILVSYPLKHFGLTWSSPKHSQKWLQSLELGKLPGPGHLRKYLWMKEKGEYA